MDVEIKNDDVVRRLLETRSKELGETTKQSATALMITALKSLRGNTRVASPTRGKKITVRTVTAQYRPTWKTKDGGKHFCFMRGRGRNRTQIVPPEDWRVVYDKGVLGTKTFYCEDIRSQYKVYKYLVVSTDAGRAREIVNAYHTKRVLRYKSLARYALGVSMAKLAANTGLENTSPAVKDSALQSVFVETKDSGFDSGEVCIRVIDDLSYAAKALKGGEGYISQAMNNAMNRTVGLLMQKLKQNGKLNDSLKADLESLKR